MCAILWGSQCFRLRWLIGEVVYLWVCLVFHLVVYFIYLCVPIISPYLFVASVGPLTSVQYQNRLGPSQSTLGPNQHQSTIYNECCSRITVRLPMSKLADCWDWYFCSGIKPDRYADKVNNARTTALLRPYFHQDWLNSTGKSKSGKKKIRQFALTCLCGLQLNHKPWWTTSNRISHAVPSYNKNQWVMYPSLDIQLNCFCIESEEPYLQTRIYLVLVFMLYYCCVVDINI